MWMNRVRVFADGGDSRAKCISNGFAHAFYATMEESYQKITDTEVVNEELSLKPAEDGQPMSFKDHKKQIDNILLILAEDSVTDAVRRVIKFGRQVVNRKR